MKLFKNFMDIFTIYFALILRFIAILVIWIILIALITEIFGPLIALIALIGSIFCVVYLICKISYEAVKEIYIRYYSYDRSKYNYIFFYVVLTFGAGMLLSGIAYIITNFAILVYTTYRIANVKKFSIVLLITLVLYIPFVYLDILYDSFLKAQYTLGIALILIVEIAAIPLAITIGLNLLKKFRDESLTINYVRNEEEKKKESLEEEKKEEPLEEEKKEESLEEEKKKESLEEEKKKEPLEEEKKEESLEEEKKDINN